MFCFPLHSFIIFLSGLFFLLLELAVSLNKKKNLLFDSEGLALGNQFVGKYNFNMYTIKSVFLVD